MFDNELSQRFIHMCRSWPQRLHTLSCSIALAGAGLLLLTSCDALPTPQETRESHQEAFLSSEADAHLSTDANRHLARLRGATAPFFNLDKAEGAEYGPITACVEHPLLGAQGIHYGKGALINDAEINVEQPEVLMYEPRKNGKLHLVGVEYIIPFAFLSADSDPPELFGKHFHANEDLGLWALHVWAWRHNPNGLFADWNPNVSCMHAEE